MVTCIAQQVIARRRPRKLDGGPGAHSRDVGNLSPCRLKPAFRPERRLQPAGATAGLTNISRMRPFFSPFIFRTAGDQFLSFTSAGVAVGSGLAVLDANVTVL